ncbi:hypothetical protein ES705_26834 [subsurface metagenome]
MVQQIVPQQVQPYQAPAPLSQVTAESFTAVMSVIMAVWAGTWVLSQVIKVFKGEEVEKPLILK